MKTVEFKFGSVIILSGLPGAGKSSIQASAKFITPVKDCWLSMDDIRENLFGMKTEIDSKGCEFGTLSQEDNARVFRIFHSQAYDRISQGLTTVLDGVFLNDRLRETFVEMAVEFGSPCLVAILDTPLEDCLKGNRNRYRRVPEDVIKSMTLEKTSAFDHVLIKRGDVLLEKA